MRLADFILANVEPILAEWETFARSVTAGAKMDRLALRDHAEDILRATVRDMNSAQSALQQSDKSMGHGDSGKASARLDGASEIHGIGRVGSGFDLIEVIAEYRALRASVIRLWSEKKEDPDRRDVVDLTRFNESIDQSLTEAVRSYTERINRSRQMFLAILGHDLRNPLNSAMMSAELLMQSPQLDADTRETASQISTSVAAMGHMIGDLLVYTGSGLGAGMPLSKAPMDLKSLCEEVVHEIQVANPGRSVRFAPQGDLTGEWDATRIRQLVSNLLGNAMQHGAANEAVDLTADGEASNVRLAFRNGGPPIPEDVLPTIFEPLVRSSSTEPQKQRRPGSIGLGLYIAREVVTAHGGDIDVKSSAPTGTVFTVRLPRRHVS